MEQQPVAPSDSTKAPYIRAPYVGQPVRRREDFRFITGQGRYLSLIHI